jgi:hypothetical protein
MANSKKTFLLTCQEATFLITQKESIALSFFNRLKLNYHVLNCPPCKRYIAQSQQIETWMTSYIADPQTSSHQLPEAFKQHLQQKIDNEI